MKVALRDGNPAKLEDIALLEEALGITLDFRFQNFLRQDNGATPASNAFTVNGIVGMAGITKFIDVRSITKERKYIYNIGALAYPVAECAFGNYILLNQGQEGSILFWDHEWGESSFLAENFDAFLDMIEPFDATSVKSSDGQIVSAWINPEFLAQISN